MSVDFRSLSLGRFRNTSVSDDDASSVSTHESVTSVSSRRTFVEDVGRNGDLPIDPLLEKFSPRMNGICAMASVSFCFPLFNQTLEEESFGVSISASDWDDTPLSTLFLLISWTCAVLAHRLADLGKDPITLELTL